jgi:hypothetical protein
MENRSATGALAEIRTGYIANKSQTIIRSALTQQPQTSSHGSDTQTTAHTDGCGTVCLHGNAGSYNESEMGGNITK